MFGFLKNMKLNIKISILGAGSVMITAAALVTLAVWQSGQYNRLAQREVDQLIDADLDHITQGAYNLVRTEDEAVQEKVKYNLNVMRHVLANNGDVRLSGETVGWTAINQFTGERSGLLLPKMLIGGRWLGQNADPAVRTGVVDEATKLVGETATIFQRMNNKGDMLRVATTVIGKEGKRAIGTYIPAVNPDGGPNPVIAAILKGKTYHGRAYVVNAWYLTAYEPLKDGAGKLVGMLYVGIKQKNVESRIRQAILQTTVGKTGYVYVLGGKGEDRGRYIISQRGERDGEDIWDSKDSDGRYVVREIIKKAIALKPGELATERYRWQNPGEEGFRWKVARLAYYAPWDWVIGTGVHEDELQSYRAILSGGRVRMTRTMGMAGIAITLFIGLIGILVAWTITRNVRRMTRAVETIIGGDLDQVVDVGSRDEIGTLAETFNIMTERLKVTMEVLRESEKKYRTIFENAVEGLFQTSFEGQFLNVNPAMARILGYDSPDELMANIADIRHQLYVRGEDRDEITSGIMARGGVFGHECQLYCKNKQIIWVSISAHVAKDDTGKPLFIEGFFTDITERKRLEARLLQSQKMEAIGTLAGGVAHDFNNILTVLMGYGTLLQMALEEDDPLQAYVDHILTSSRKAVNLTSSLLTFSRLQPVRLNPVNVNDAIRGTEKLLKRLITEDITLSTCLASEEMVVMADTTQIDQILFNLATNARDAMPKGGKMSIETSLVELDSEFARNHGLEKPGRYVLLSVSDTGSGMDARTRERIFDPFFTTKEAGKGTGLGLPTVYGIVKQHEGYINLYSEKDIGTTFHIYLPAITAVVEEDAAPPRQVTGGNETILVADDDTDVRRLIKDVLTKYGYTVTEAADGEDAVIKFRELGKTDLLVIDSVMPGKNGREVYEEICKMTPGMKVLFISGYTRDVILDKGIEDGKFDFISKPIIPDTFLQVVREILDRQ